MGCKKGSVPWNKGKNKSNDSSVQKISTTMISRKLDNFSEWRKRAREMGLIPNCNNKFVKSKQLAFLIGLVLGDGNIYKFPRTECLRLTLGSDKPKLVEYSTYVFEYVFEKKPSVIRRSTSNCFNVTIYQKNLGNRLGIPTGARGNLPVKLPKWIWNNKKYLVLAIKGLFEAEASYCVHLKTYTYNFEFSNRNSSLLDEVETALRILGYNPERRMFAVRLRRKNEVLRFRDLIEFRVYPPVI